MAMVIPFPGGAIRPWARSDAADLARLADNRKVWRNLRDRFPNPYSRQDAKAWIKGVTGLFPCTHFAIETRENPDSGAPPSGAPDPVLAGGIGLLLQEDVHLGTAEIGYWLGEPFWGRGIMTAALASFTAHAFEAFRLRRIYARVLEWNPASMRVLEKSGFVLEGRMRRSALKDGAVADELLYAKVDPGPDLQVL